MHLKKWGSNGPNYGPNRPFVDHVRFGNGRKITSIAFSKGPRLGFTSIVRLAQLVRHLTSNRRHPSSIPHDKTLFAVGIEPTTLLSKSAALFTSPDGFLDLHDPEL